MNLKQKAALHTAGLFATVIGTSVVISYVASLLTVAQVQYGLGVLCICGLVFTMYQVVLSRLEYKESFNESLKRMAEKSVDSK